MAANVETMMYAGETPWHGLGVKVENNVTSEQAIRAAGLDWTVSKRGVFIANPATGLAEKVPGYAAITRDSDQYVMAVMGDKYQPLQNHEAFGFMDALVGEKLAMFHTAGALDHGRRIWMLAQLPGELRIAGTDDVTKMYVLLATSHDGTLSTIMKNVGERVVCANTLRIALSERSNSIKIRHTKNAESKLVEAKRILGIATAQYREFETVANNMFQTAFSEQQMKDLAESLFPANEKGEVSSRAVTSRETLMNLFESGKGAEMTRGTAWGAYNAVTEFTSHYRTTRVTDGEKDEESTREARLNSVWFGSGDAMNAKALSLLAA